MVFFFDIDIGSFTVTNSTEFLVLILLVFNLNKIPSLITYDKKLIKIPILYLCIGIFFLFISIFYLNTDFSRSIGVFRRLFIFPFLGIMVGRLMYYNEYNNQNFIPKIIKIFPYVLSLLVLIDLTIINYHFNTFSRYITRFDAFV